MIALQHPKRLRNALRGNPVWAFCALLVVFLCYLWSAPRTVVLEDDGFFIISAFFNGVAHPPGYPLFTALGHLAAQVPAGTVAYRIHALSGAFGALACVALWRLACRLLQPSYALLAALALGFSAVFWSQAIIAEVYTLNVAFLFLLAGLAIHWPERSPNGVRGRALAFGLCYGLSLCNHWPLMLVSTPALALLLWPVRKDLRRCWSALAGGGMLGLSPYLWMIYRTHVVPEFSFFGPIGNWSDFWFYLSREGYREVDLSVSAGWRDKLAFSGFALTEAARQFGPLGAAFMLAGLWRQFRVWPAWLCWGLVFAFVGNTLALVGLLGFDYDELRRNTFRVYPLAAYGVAALWLALGAQWAVTWLEARLAGRARPALLAGGMVLLLAGSAWLTHAAVNYRAHDTWADDYARVILGTLPQQAVLYANADTVNGPVGYLHWVEGLRPDIRLLSGFSFPFHGTLYRPYRMTRRDFQILIRDFVRSTPRPIFYTNDFPHPFGAADYGLYFGLNRAAGPEFQRASAVPRIQDYFARIAAGDPPADPWERMHYLRLRLDHCRLWAGLGGAASSAEPPPPSPAPCGHLRGRLLLVQRMLAQTPFDQGRAVALLDEARAMLAQTVTRADVAELEWLAAEVLLRAGRRPEALRQLRRAWELWPHPSNPAAARLQAFSEG